MSQVSQEAVEQSEGRLWSDYMTALAGLHDAWRHRDDAWRRYVMSGMKDEVARGKWQRWSELQDSWMEREMSAHKAWKRVAYPLYNLGHLLHNDDED